MNVFQTHAGIIDDYATYIRSFLNIADPTIREVVEGELSQGKLWPEPLLQFNPSFERAGTATELASTGTLEPFVGACNSHGTDWADRHDAYLGRVAT